MAAYYNEFDPFAAAWLRELIKAGHIADGDVDERSIIEVTADDVRGYTQHHFFAGIGGWSYAARLAGWPDDKPLFTGSPPCQPFSAAGKRLGAADERHLAPHWLELVKAVRPPFVAGEQVAAAINKDAWLDDLLDALEAEDYATGAIVLQACGIGAPHIRQRIFFVGRLAHAGSQGSSQQRRGLVEPERPAEAGAVIRRANPESQRYDRGEDTSGQEGRDGAEIGGTGCGMADSSSQRRQQDTRSALSDEATNGGEGRNGRESNSDHQPSGVEQIYRHESAHAPQTGWNAVDWLLCRDGKWRPVESGSQPLANGVSSRVGRLRGYGNAIVPQVAAEVLNELLIQELFA
jgi:DNA (cytosine-5)-methyltransferase 1